MTRPYETRFIDFLRTSSKDIPSEIARESAIPSFSHPNPLIRWFFWQRIRMALKVGRDVPCRTILDFGTGSGVLLPFITQKAEKVFALDVNTEMALRAKEAFGLKNVEIMKTDGNTIPLATGSVDCVYALEVFEHIENIDRVIAELSRVCRKGGYLVFSGPTENAFYRFGRFLAGFKGDYHKVRVSDIMKSISKKFLCLRTFNLFPLLTFYIFGLYRKDL